MDRDRDALQRARRGVNGLIARVAHSALTLARLTRARLSVVTGPAVRVGGAARGQRGQGREEEKEHRQPHVVV